MPCHIKTFHDITTNYRSAGSPKGELINVVIMGENTSQQIPQKDFPLKDRINIILTKKYCEDLNKMI